MKVLFFAVTALLITDAIRASSYPDVIPEGRITRGTPVLDSTFPFMACLYSYNSIIGYRTGTGTIISDLYILSAAHFTSK